MYALIKPLLFRLDAETAHHLVLNTLNWLPACVFNKIASTNPVHAMGLSFPHAIGLAAGLDKNGDYIDALNKLGFAFIEIGTVTPKPQIGNPKPRLFRLPAAQAVINRMGFNNAGVDKLIENVKKSSYQGILGINIGKNKDTSLNDAADDYLICLKKVYPYASYITINISSPNTPDLRQLQQRDYLDHLINKLTQEQQRLSDQYQRWVPLLIKLSPDESDETLKQMTQILLKYKIAGIIATNTTCDHSAVTQLPHGQETGGLSGTPLLKRSTHCLQLLKAEVGSSITLIGVGGIHDAASAQEKLAAGASLLQVYTGLIYRGPGIVQQLAILNKDKLRRGNL